MLEAKAKDQRHKRKCSQKKKGLHKNFSIDLHKKTFSKKWNRLGLHSSEMMEVMEDREVWRLNLELLPLQPSRI